ncbi:hypothetical protein HALLA_04940 [Halostagnicola larsenii XH-48]|uniref:Uncharacterized protein n=1 Tax=Halostagnicola larsenii XH-48 TaxID=797299 RepID=W0JME4_9EURY|nr:hypothetical protein [Halostagnicola larsenii]AHF98319.1 hypothetical protein HALLA_04940 [Halostagnicola larsenii XH-48]
MSLMQRSLPREELPPNWGPLEHSDDRIAYRHSSPPLTLIAVCVSADRSHPSLGLSRYWEIRYRYSIGECTTTEVLGRVTTYDAALEGLLECMIRVHDTVESPDSPLDLCTVLGSVSLPASVPDEPSTVS